MFDVSVDRDRVLERFSCLKIALEKNGHTVHTYDRFSPKGIDFLLFSRIDAQLRIVLATVRANPAVRLIYIPIEPPLIVPFHAARTLARLPVDLVLSWNDKAVELSPRVLKSEIGEPLIRPDEIPKVPFSEKKTLCAVFANKSRAGKGELYSVRRRLVRFFARRDVDFDLFGMGWHDDTDPLIKQVYRGPVDSKIETMKNYRFSICVENADTYPGYITEKVFDSFAAGCVPVYLGPLDIGDRIPLSSMIDLRSFDALDDLLECITNVTADKYEAMIESARLFIQSERYLEFTSTAFASRVAKAIESLTAIPARKHRKAVTLKTRTLLAILAGSRLSGSDFVRFRRIFFDLFR